MKGETKASRRQQRSRTPSASRPVPGRVVMQHDEHDDLVPQRARTRSNSGRTTTPRSGSRRRQLRAQQDSQHTTLHNSVGLRDGGTDATNAWVHGPPETILKRTPVTPGSGLGTGSGRRRARGKREHRKAAEQGQPFSPDYGSTPPQTSGAWDAPIDRADPSKVPSLPGSATSSPCETPVGSFDAAQSSTSHPFAACVYGSSLGSPSASPYHSPSRVAAKQQSKPTVDEPLSPLSLSTVRDEDYFLGDDAEADGMLTGGTSSRADCTPGTIDRVSVRCRQSIGAALSSGDGMRLAEQRVQAFIRSSECARRLPLQSKQLRQVPIALYNYAQSPVPGPHPKLVQELTELQLCNNAITELPVEIGDLQHLKMLDVTDNELTVLPLELRKLSNLRSLLASHNQLDSKSIDPGMFEVLPGPRGLVRLESLQLNHNSIKELPVELRELLRCYNLGGRLTVDGIGIDGCPLETPPLSALSSDEDTLHFFEELTEVREALQRKQKRDFLAECDKRCLRNLVKLHCICRADHQGGHRRSSSSSHLRTPSPANDTYGRESSISSENFVSTPLSMRSNSTADTSGWDITALDSPNDVELAQRSRSNPGPGLLRPRLQRSRTFGLGGGAIGAQQHLAVLPPPLQQRSVSMQSNLSEISDFGSFEPDPEWDECRKQVIEGDDIATQRVLGDLCQSCRSKGKLLVRQLGKNCIALLALFSSPTSLPKLNLMREILTLHRKVKREEREVCPAVRWPADVERVLHDTWPRVLQFSGHGYPDVSPAQNCGAAAANVVAAPSGSSRLVFEIDLAVDGRQSPNLSVPSAEHFIAQLSSDRAPRLACVYFNACYTAAIGRLIVANDRCRHLRVLCWETLVLDRAALAFSRGFYDSLAEHCDFSSDDGDVKRWLNIIDDAFAHGCAAFASSGRFKPGDPAGYKAHMCSHWKTAYDKNCPSCNPPVHGRVLLLSWCSNTNAVREQTMADDGTVVLVDKD